MKNSNTTKEVAGGLLFVSEHRRGTQLRDFRWMPPTLRFGGSADIVDYISEPTGFKRS